MEEKRSKRNKKATIYDIANEVGTSTATVSRVLSNSGYPVSEELKRKILNAARKLNYTPNIVGRMLKKSGSTDIGVIIPTISNPFYAPIVLGIELEARKRGYNILLCNSLRNPELERKSIETLYQKQVTGIIISTIDKSNEFIKEMQKYGVKFITFDQNIADINCSRIGFDFVKGGLIAVEHLISMGHRKIAFLSSPLTRSSRKETYEGYNLGLLKNGLSYDERFILVSEYEEETPQGTYEFENGKYLAELFLKIPEKERPTAIFAVNDMTAVGIIQKFVESGVRVPEDVSIIGFDNIEISSMINPPLTTVNQPAFETGRLACKLLLDSLQDKQSNDFSITLEPSLVVRKSVKRIHR